MPCDSSHMAANRMEIELSRVACLLDELDGQPFKQSHWDGYHPLVYCKPLTKEIADAMVASLCSKLKAIDVTKCSLEMQIWWRDHQRVDQLREEREAAVNADAALRAEALAKLSADERRVLGLDTMKEPRT